MNETETVRRAPRDSYAANEAPTRRMTADRLTLVREAAGGPGAWAAKAGRLVRTVGIVARPSLLDARLARLRARGLVPVAPTRLQLVQLGIDMMRYFIEPGVQDYYASRGIGFRLQVLLRLLDDPSSMIDPVGVVSDRDVIVGHLLQVVHANPVYDLQLLEMFDDGLDELEAQARAMVAGTHPRARSIGAVIEDVDYHARLLEYLLRYRRDPRTPELRRRAGSARESASFVLAEETFGALPSAFRYATRLPRTLGAAIAHVREAKQLDPALCDPETVRAVERAFAEARING